MPVGRKVALSNQKGGVGKTTSAINLAAAMVEEGRRVLVIDLDPQGNASTGLGVAPEDRELTSMDLLMGADDPAALIRGTSIAGLSVVPSNMDLSSADVELADHRDRTGLLRAALRAPAFEAFDDILLDCPPSLSILTLNALIAADSVLVPLQAEFFALEGLSQLLRTVREVRRGANPGLRIEGVLLTMVDARNRLARQVESDARETLGELVFETMIPRNVRISEAPSFAQSVLDYDPRSRGSKAYRDLAAEILKRREMEVSA